ncbi:hypothetical protein GCM10022421_22050 [Oceanisphaera sediminis]|uniref:GGDEF domain-containing protein n=1 Tax=Oceanisphaera sediminis TaxID=981381 RepID=A0ABP7E626_9GAMM
MLISVIEQAILILASGWLLTMNIRRGQQYPRLMVLTTAFWFAAIAIACMSLPFMLGPGVLLDVRDAVFFVAGLFGGPLAGGLALLMAGGFRFWLDGAGVFPGIAGMVIALTAGLGMRYALQQRWLRLNVWSLLPVTLLLNVIKMGLLYLMVEPQQQPHILSLTLPFLIIVVPLTLILVFILKDAEQRGREQQALRDSEARLTAITSALPDTMCVIDEDGCYLDVMAENTNELYATTGSMVGKTVWDIFPDEQAETFLTFIRRTLKLNTVNTLIYDVETSGGPRTFECVAQILKSQPGDKAAVVTLNRDISARVKNETELRIAAVAFESFQGMLVTDKNNRILRINRAFSEITGYTQEELIGKTPAIFSSGKHDGEFYRQMWHSINTRGHWQGEICDKRKSGKLYPQLLSISEVKDAQGQRSHYVAQINDITDRKNDAEKINHLAFYDVLTGLPNRRLLLERITQTRLKSVEYGKLGAMILIDLDNFKNINDLWGHSVGDKLLLQVAGRLREVAGQQDTLARLGSDQFALLLDAQFENQAQLMDRLEHISHALLDSLDQPYAHEELKLRSSGCLGVVMLDADSLLAEELLRQAELAMYEAKAAGKGEIRFFDPEMQEVISQRLLLEEDIVRGLHAGEFNVYFQPQFNDDGGMTGTEALVRWHHPERGILAPGAFIEVAEAAGLMNQIDHVVLQRSCEQMASWARLEAFSNVTVSVNISSIQLYQPGFVQEVLNILQQTGANPALLKLELTESMLLTDMPQAISRMRLLKQSGIRFAIDDFGTGYSSLHYLQQLPLDQLKIDQSFVRGLPYDSNSLAIIRAIIAMAKSLELEVIAEGVETEAQRAILLNNGCRLYQGYLFARPGQASDVEALVFEAAEHGYHYEA